MISLLKKALSSIVPWSSDFPGDDIEENEQMIINRIKKMSVDEREVQENTINDVTSTTEEQKLLGQSNLVEYNVETFRCVPKKGKVTHLSNEYGLINGTIYFEPRQVAHGLEINVHDEVCYMAFKVRENETDRVHKIYSVKSNFWEPGNGVESEYQTQDTSQIEEVHAISRIITGRVTERKGREVYIESADIWCNLDKIRASFIPVEGDWVELNAFVAVNADAANLSGDILDVQSLKPLLTKSGFGRVTFWSSIKRDGAIENHIYFSIVSCEEGYIPSLGDEVVYDAVESDQDRFRWRALKVFVDNLKPGHKYKNNHRRNTLPQKGKNDQYSDKNDISILPAVCSVEIELNQTKIVAFEIINNGTVKQFLKSTKFQPRKNSQLVLLSPKACSNFFIHPNQSILFKFECKGKYLGLTAEIFYFHFDSFTIAKRFEINVVGNKEMNELLECKMGTAFKFYKEKKILKDKVDPEIVLYGPRPWKPPKFIAKEKKCLFTIPKTLWKLSDIGSGGPKFVEALIEYAPCLKNDLCFQEYGERYHTLLFLEEMELKLNFRRYDMTDVFLFRSEDYFVLNVPGLVEKRPSLIIGDKIVVSKPWDDGKAKFVGYIHEIRAEEIFIKFHSAFDKTYDESLCSVTFEANTSFYSRCHDAVNRAIKTLGEQWLFPTAVNEKLPLINFQISGEEEALKDNVEDFFTNIPIFQTEKKVVPPTSNLEEIESGMKPEFGKLKESWCKKLIWVNNNLNDRQKLAVVGVLEGRGRPLPYIIFGPPGTGKTITLVEVIVQLYRMISESRILVTTPSNSAADLITERLIDLGHFKPGQLVRLVALYRVYDSLVPPKLIPYTTFFNPRGYLDKNVIEGFSKFGVRGSSFNELIGRHRITIATCVTIGTLHYAGLHSGHFTHILVDEAGQTSEPEVLITATFQNMKNGQLVLVGDPQQLGPVICSQVAKNFGLGTSLLQRLISRFPYTRDLDGFPNTSGFDPRFITKLNINYRSIPEILSLPSHLFYNSDLIPTVSQTEGKEAEIVKKFNFEGEGRITPSAVVFHGVIGQNYQGNDSPSWFNPHEIWQVVFYMRKLYNMGLSSEDIGIVSPYAKQAQKLKNLLPSLGMATPKIGSVEEFQGQERFVIIVTTVRSSCRHLHSDIVHSLGFVASPQRLNVALTRARALLIIVGNPFLLAKDPYWISVIKYCLKNNCYTGCSLDTFGQSHKRRIDGEEKENGDAPDESV